MTCDDNGTVCFSADFNARFVVDEFKKNNRAYCIIKKGRIIFSSNFTQSYHFISYSMQQLRVFRSFQDGLSESAEDA